MTRLVLALSSVCRGGAAPAEALRRARELGAEVVALFVVDDRTVHGLDRRMSDAGFIGERPCADLVRAALEEWERIGHAALAEVQAACDEAGVPCRTRLVRGERVERTLSAVAEEGAELCVVPEAPRSRLARWLRPGDAARLAAGGPCQVVPVAVQEEPNDR